MERTAESYLWLILLVLHLFYLALLSQLNYTLSSLSLFLFINASFITFPALFFPFGHGLTATLLFSLLYDAGESWALGTSLVPSLIAFVTVYQIRGRISFTKKGVQCGLILLVNLGLYLYYTVLAATLSPLTLPVMSLTIVQLAFSQLFLALLSGWIVAQQKSVLQFFRIDVDSLSLPAK